MGRLAYCIALVAFMLAVLAALPKTAHSQSMPTPAVTRGVVAAVASGVESAPDADNDPFIVVDGQRQVTRSALGTELLWRTPGHALTDMLARMPTTTCDEDHLPWRVDGRPVACLRYSRRAQLTVAEQAVFDLQNIRVQLLPQCRMTDSAVGTLRRARTLIDVILYARSHHGHAPRAHRSSRHH